MSGNQVRSMSGQKEGQPPEPHETLEFFQASFDMFEKQVAAALDAYSGASDLGVWARLNIGIGPVIAAGLLAHIDIERAPTAGAIWRFAGLDPTAVWEKGKKRPHNAKLKVLCWKMGGSFVKFKSNPGCLYGHIYEQRKLYEVERNENGGNAEWAERSLAERTFRDKAVKKVYESGKLPDGRIDLRARRYAVKIFLAHYHEAAYRLRYKKLPPKPYVLEHVPGHVHAILPAVEMPPVKGE